MIIYNDTPKHNINIKKHGDSFRESAYLIAWESMEFLKYSLMFYQNKK